MKKYGKYIQIKSDVPHVITKLNEYIKLTSQEVITNNDFLRNFNWDGMVRSSETKEIRVKTKYEKEKVFLISSDGYWGFVSLQPKNNPDKNNILLGDFN